MFDLALSKASKKAAPRMIQGAAFFIGPDF